MNIIVKNTPRLHPNGRKRGRVGHRPGPIGTESTSHKLGRIRGCRKLPVFKNWPRTQGKRGGIKQLGPWKRSKRDREEFVDRHRPPIVHD